MTTHAYAHKTRCYPTKAQEAFLLECFRASRWAYNFGLMAWEEKYKAGEKVSAFDISRLWTQRKNRDPEYQWVNDVPRTVVGYALTRQLDKAFKNFFARCKKGGTPGYPKYKDKTHQSATMSNSNIKAEHIDLTARRVRLPNKQGFLRLGDVPSSFTKLNSTTFSYYGGRWYCSFQLEGDRSKPVAPLDVVGVDMGVAEFAFTSDGENLEHLTGIDYDTRIKRLEVGIENLQKQLALKTYKARNGRQYSNKSQNVAKLRAKIAAKHAEIMRLRQDRVHKTTAILVGRYNRVAVEDLKLLNMTASAAGTVEEPGSQVAQKSGLNRAILRQGIGEFYRVLDYKLNWAEGKMIAVNPAYTSQTCPACGHVDKANRPKRDTFSCVKCGYSAHADQVGAINIMQRAIQPERAPATPVRKAKKAAPTPAPVTPAIPAQAVDFSRISQASFW